jgi:hypothetical protein
MQIAREIAKSRIGGGRKRARATGMLPTLESQHRRTGESLINAISTAAGQFSALATLVDKRAFLEQFDFAFVVAINRGD